MSRLNVSMEPKPVTAFVGVDVSEDKLDVCVLPGGECLQFTNDSPGRDQLVAHLKSLPNCLIVIKSKYFLFTRLGPAGESLERFVGLYLEDLLERTSGCLSDKMGSRLALLCDSNADQFLPRQKSFFFGSLQVLMLARVPQCVNLPYDSCSAFRSMVEELHIDLASRRLTADSHAYFDGDSSHCATRSFDPRINTLVRFDGRRSRHCFARVCS